MALPPGVVAGYKPPMQNPNTDLVPGYSPPRAPRTNPFGPGNPSGGTFSLPMTGLGSLMSPQQPRTNPFVAAGPGQGTNFSPYSNPQAPWAGFSPGFSPGFRPQATPGPWGRSVASAPGGIGQNYMRNFANQFGGGQNAIGLFGGGDPTMALQNAFGIRGVTPEMLMRYMQGGYNPQQVANYISRNTM